MPRADGARHTEVFARGLSDAFLSELQTGRFAELLTRAKQEGLDVQIRENYLDIYADGCRVLSLLEKARSGYEAAVHEKYLGETRLPGERRRNPSRGVYHEASDAFTAAYLAAFSTIVTNARALAKPERALEERIIRANNASTSPVVFLDRQVQMHGVRKKADLLGLLSTPDRDACVLLTEIKQGQSVPTRSLMGQIAAYYEVFCPGGRLRECLAEAYRKVVSQKQQLGLLPLAKPFPDVPLQVECLLVLCDRRPTSNLLSRLRAVARAVQFEAKLVCLPKDRPLLPPPQDWIVL